MRRYGDKQFHYIQDDLKIVVNDYPKWLMIGLADLHRLVRTRLACEVILDEMDGFI